VIRAAARAPDARPLHASMPTITKPLVCATVATRLAAPAAVAQVTAGGPEHLGPAMAPGSSVSPAVRATRPHDDQHLFWLGVVHSRADRLTFAPRHADHDA
jgi:hypothetical protein